MILRFAKLSLLVLIFIACKKDKLTDDKEILVGTWSWYKTEKVSSLCNPPSFETELTPTTENKNFEIKFFEKGKVEFYENNSNTHEYRIVFTLFGGSGCDYLDGYTYYGIDLDNNPELDLDGCICSDTLIVIRGFPYSDPVNACENYTSYFVRK